MLVVVVFIAGLALAWFAWKPILVGLMLAGIGGVCLYFACQGTTWGGYLPFDDPTAIYGGPALLLGWAMGLLIRRTITERNAR